MSERWSLRAINPAVMAALVALAKPVDEATELVVKPPPVLPNGYESFAGNYPEPTPWPAKVGRKSRRAK